MTPPEQELKIIPGLPPEEAAALQDTPVSRQDSAAQEAKLLSRGSSIRDLKREAEERDYDRDQVFKSHFERVAIFALWVLATGLLFAGCMWLLQLVLPENLRWIDGERFDKLQDIVRRTACRVFG